MTARVLNDAPDVTSVETTTQPIEVWLSQPHLEITCRIVFPDGTAIAVGVDALSLRDAQREMTAWLIERGYEPADRWSTHNEKDRRAVRTFRCQDHGSALPGPSPRPPAQFQSSQNGSSSHAPNGQARTAAVRAGRAAGPRSRAGGGRANTPHAAEKELRAWALANARREDVIREASAAGVSLDRIQELTGIALTTIMRILGSPPRPTEAGRRR